jgi:uncharacterized membrane protein YdbT with pleckstrin-like domain
MALSVSPQLLAGESVLATERQHPAVLAPAAVIAALCIGVPVFLIHRVPERVGDVRTGSVTAVAAAAVVVAVALWFLVRVLRWRLQTYPLTTHRIVMRRGVVSQVTKSISLDRVQDIVVRKPALQRLIGSGSVEIDAAGRDGIEVLHLIPRPDRFYTDILQAVEDHRRMTAARVAPAAPPAPGSPPPPPAARYSAAGSGL